MNEPPTTADRRAKRFKRIRVALLVLLICYLAVYTCSTIWTVHYDQRSFGISTGYGAIGVFIVFVKDPNTQIHVDKSFSPGWKLTSNPRAPSIVNRPQFRYIHDHLFLTVPLWLPLLPLLLLAALLVYRDRTRRPPGHCRKCNYNLTGNTTGRCPECGVPTDANTETSKPTPKAL